MQMEQRRRLTDLYARGRTIKVQDPEEGIFEEVYLRKMTPPELDEAFARATSARSRVIAAAKDGSDEMFVTLKKDVLKMTHDELVNWVVTSEVTSKRPIIEAQVAAEDEWAKDRYLSGLREFVQSDAYKEQKAANPEDAEVVRVDAQLERFSAQVEELVNDEIEAQRNRWDGVPDEKMQEQVLEELSDMKGNSEWLVEYKKSQIWLCAHSVDNHKVRYFDSREEIDQLQKPVIEQLLNEIENLHVSDAEGKG